MTIMERPNAPKPFTRSSIRRSDKLSLNPFVICQKKQVVPVKNRGKSYYDSQLSH